jgi:hypothetical protein
VRAKPSAFRAIRNMLAPVLALSKLHRQEALLGVERERRLTVRRRALFDRPTRVHRARCPVGSDADSAATCCTSWRSAARSHRGAGVGRLEGIAAASRLREGSP